MWPVRRRGKGDASDDDVNTETLRSLTTRPL